MTPASLWLAALAVLCPAPPVLKKCTVSPRCARYEHRGPIHATARRARHDRFPLPRSEYPSLLPIFFAGAELTIDHVTAAGARLKDLQANLSAVGIGSDYGGPHGNRATEM